MKITNLEIFITNPGEISVDESFSKSIKFFGKNLIFVKIETDIGITGWGECYSQSDRDTQITSHVEKMKKYLIDYDPLNIRNFILGAQRDFSNKRPSMDFWCAVSGIEIAMWDIVGKYYEQPVYNLLGGKIREKIKVYANGWATSLEEEDLSKNALDMVNRRGFKALKFDPFTGPWEDWPENDILFEASKRVGVVRESVGPEIDILIEVHRRLSVSKAQIFTKEIEKYNPFWIEEPCISENLDGIKEVKDITTVPIVTGEALYSRNMFKDVCKNRAVDIINPDICNTGGILELTLIASMAETFSIGVSPHGWNSTGVGASAALNVSSVINNFIIYEYMVHVEEFSKKITNNHPVVENSYIELNNLPGLGTSIKEEELTFKENNIKRDFGNLD
ncbi:MAG: mandelate racemase [Chloroflexi bacterium]|nr:mandelate racemase [Chloroflexota bacterium]|tara:strand:- start:17102 stop:18277 length:1176 start_codon:yes stop_codon:yes gene_type:complete